MTPDLLPERLASRIVVDDAGCWLWQAGRNNSGYGKVSWLGGYKSTHRVTYELLVAAIPDGLQIDHLCRVRECCNPQHLEPVTPGENSRRSPFYKGGKPRPPKSDRVRGRDNHCGRGHELTDDNVYVIGVRRRCRTCHINRQREYRKRAA